jgi:hypothetical protein
MAFSHRLEPLLPVLLTLEGIEKVLEELDGMEMPLFAMPLYTKNEHFAKTGSGQT